MTVTENTTYLCKKCGHTVFSLDFDRMDLETCPNCGKVLDADDILELGVKLRMKNEDLQPRRLEAFQTFSRSQKKA